MSFKPGGLSRSDMFLCWHDLGIWFGALISQELYQPGLPFRWLGRHQSGHSGSGYDGMGDVSGHLDASCGAIIAQAPTTALLWPRHLAIAG